MELDSQKYQEHLETVLRDLRAAATNGEPITADLVVAGLQPSQDNKVVVDWATGQGIKAEEIRKALWRKGVRDKLGCVPANAEEFVAAVVRRDSCECLINGMVERRVKATMGDGSPIDLDAASPDLKEYAAITQPGRIDRSEFGLLLRLEADRLGLKFSRDAIADAMDGWANASQRQRRHRIVTQIKCDLTTAQRAEAKAKLLDLVPRCFDATATSPEFAAAVIEHFVWQVKRKMLNIPVTGHLMLVILGRQGTGKTTAIKKLYSPVSELATQPSFSMVGDERNIDLWSNAVLFIDEMQHAPKADIDTIKHAITADYLPRRPMRSNASVDIPQLTTFIGATNKELQELIRDATGMRRFLGLRWRSDAEWDAVNAFDWLALWKMVDPHAGSPLIGHEETLRREQEGIRVQGPVEVWLADGLIYKPGDEIAVKALYGNYREWSERYDPDARLLSMQAFGVALAALERDHPEICPLGEKRHRRDGAYYKVKDTGTDRVVWLRPVADQGGECGPEAA